ncbi:MAG: hypothetical protein WCB93_08105, partial [Gallionella sp.]
LSVSYLANIYNVLIASPSDVELERKIIVELLHEWNAANSAKRHIALMPVMWETHSGPELNSRPQDVINREVVDDCDLAIGVFWSRLGTPTDDAESGTIEEITRMGTAQKLVMLYFSNKELPYDHDADQLVKVKAFKGQCFKNGYVEQYQSLEEFRKKLSRQLDIKLSQLENPAEEAAKNNIFVTTQSISGGVPVTNVIMGKGDQKEVEITQWKQTILKYLFEHTHQEQTHLSAMSKAFKLPEQKVLYYLEGFMNEDMVSSSGSYTTGQKHYSLTAQGRSFIVKNGLA